MQMGNNEDLTENGELTMTLAHLKKSSSIFITPWTNTVDASWQSKQVTHLSTFRVKPWQQRKLKASSNLLLKVKYLKAQDHCHLGCTDLNVKEEVFPHKAQS